jgi:general secretion pathway protein E
VYTPDDAELAVLAKAGKPSFLYRPIGCATCGQTGYRGRTGIYELLRVDDTLRSKIHTHESEQNLRQYAQQQSMLSLRDDALRWVISGDTSLEEVIRVTRD